MPPLFPISSYTGLAGAPWFDVHSYGAIGDGVADDSAAVQAAVDAAPASGARIVFRNKTYKLTVAITTGVKQHLVFAGAGKGSTVLSYTGAGVALTMGSAAAATPNAQVGVEDLSIQSSGTKALVFARLQDFWCLNVETICGAGTGIEILGSNGGYFRNTDGRACVVGVDFTISGAFNPNFNLFIGGQFTNNQTAIRALGLSNGNEFRGSNIAANTVSPAVKIEQALCWKFERCFFEGNAAGANTYSMQIGAAALEAVGLVVEGCEFNETCTYGIRLNVASRVTLLNNYSVAANTMIRIETGCSRVYMINNTVLAGATYSDAAAALETRIFDDTTVRLPVNMVYGSATPAQLLANTNDWNIGQFCSIVRVSANAARDLTGILAGLDGQALKLINVGANAITLKHQVTSTAANRFLCTTGADIVLAANGEVNLTYDGSTQRWRVKP